jgi:hypothetical protein
MFDSDLIMRWKYCHGKRGTGISHGKHGKHGIKKCKEIRLALPRLRDHADMQACGRHTAAQAGSLQTEGFSKIDFSVLSVFSVANY